ncbi:hypothetical protein OHS18_09725 [Amycolatopsis sp. NBC_00355]|uniref:hypothetical protein n=1 Tax=Amycolatopsis sp. NBC_00355 TaxID=2975957 RepID=UPI002E25E7AC
MTGKRAKAAALSTMDAEDSWQHAADTRADGRISQRFFGAHTAARVTPEAALEHRETRGCQNRADVPELDPACA